MRLLRICPANISFIEIASKSGSQKVAVVLFADLTSILILI